MINICVFGAGAIGGYIGCSLSKAGANISLIARGPHKENNKTSFTFHDQNSGDWEDYDWIR